MHSSFTNNNNIISSNTAASLYPFPPYNFPFNSSSSSSSFSPYNINNTHHHPFLPQENTTTAGAGFFGTLLNSDHFSLLNPCFPAHGLPETSVGGANGFYGSSNIYHNNDNHSIISHHHPAYFVSSSRKDDHHQAKVPVKKVDRHSKIFTSQGLRDRRVRLSISVAREFFDLQDLLGFDKASKTLEWLFTKSRDAIRDLQEAAAAERTTNYCNNNSSTSLSTSSSTNSDDVCDDDVSKKEAREKRRRMKEAAAVMARAARAKARARARERTREKSQICCSQLKSLSNLNSQADELNPEIIRTATTSTSSNWCSSQINIQFPNAAAAAAATHQNWNINGGGGVDLHMP